MATKRIELNDSGVLFNEELHEYWLDGKQLSGITGIIQQQLFPDEFTNIPEAMLAKAASYGTTVHKSLEDFDNSWINDGSVEVNDYIQLCKENNLVHEASEYTVTDGLNYASNIDKIFRVNDDTFDIADIKTYGTMTPDKLEKAKWQLSIYAYFFELQNKKAKIDKLFIIHLRNKEKANGEFDQKSEIIYVNRIPAEVCKDLLDTALRGEQFSNPFSVPSDIQSQEQLIRELLNQKTFIDNKLSEIKADILQRMESLDVRSWATETMKLTRKLPSVRSSFSLTDFKKGHPEISDYDSYMKTSTVAGSLLITI